MQTGYLDACTQFHCAGWAVDGDPPAVLELFINDQKITDIGCDGDRPDLVPHGLPPMAGFSFVFRPPLHVSDVVDLRFQSGSSLLNSPSIGHRPRLELLLEGIAAGGKGLELGPLYRPILGKRDYRVFYVDHASRAGLIEKYSLSEALSAVPAEDLADVDFVWNDRLRAVAGSGYAYCLASHVIEHVADPIGWMGEIAEVLTPGGRLNLAIPEKTLTFDRHRSPSTPAAMLEAHERKLRRPSFGQIFDHVSGVALIGQPELDKLVAARNAYDVASAAELTGDYLDVHCHVWTHESFLECWSVIHALDLVPFSLVRLTPPLSGSNEFTVSFVRDDRTP